ncbi:MAG TPA: ABC transporter ATP-binding protein [Bacteroidales bacterium]|jgi:putative ABC transport system ATP-binding protein|nr:ABC transporter ATP-binding protein [Bacteroidales bacterium]MCZ2416986.1 ABC transporter ATP-binding protein [Burkholderiales bacterium]OQC57045.1 MAG: Macrolide export ATP-binding/permease protein MacB [Bacteroidetes bacterium ADurb.Bin013]MBV6456413.1 putative ABC transporter ATP-binding protein YknY [Bacteroidales bacterium]NLZ09225.1 ABC transporter ATP-binding protein [Bacteroidales bacterium]
MIELREINKTYYNGAALHVLKGLNLQIDDGEFVAIMGASGSGKSTLLNIIGILDDYDTGSYHLNGKLIRDLSEKESAVYRNEMIGFVFQSFNLISFKTALENVALPLYYKGIRRSKRNRIAMEYLERMGLGEWADHMPSELSGGQKQRISIARALVANPRVILADEPTGALDSQTSVEVMQLLQQVNREGMTIVMVTHNPEMAAMSQKIIKIRDGIIGSVEQNNKASHV